MSAFDKLIPCAAVAAALLLSGSRLTGQASPWLENGRSFGLAGADDTLPEALSRVDTMLRAGNLDIASLQEDTMFPGRAHERLGQWYEGLPVFGAQVVRQMDGRSVISVTGRLYEGLQIGTTPAISPLRAGEIALGQATTIGARRITPAPSRSASSVPTRSSNASGSTSA